MAAEDIVATLRQASITQASSVLRVEVPGNVGYVFFLQGDVVHATTLEDEGEAALSQVLAWGAGALAWCERRWPKERSVHRPWLELATAAIESAPTPAASEGPPGAAAFEIEEEAPISREVPVFPPLNASTVHFPSALGIRQALSRAEFKNALRLSLLGNVSDSRGSTAHLKPILRSVPTLGDSLGAALGVGPLIAAEASAPTFHRLVARSTEDTSVVETVGGSALQLARAFLKL